MKNEKLWSEFVEKNTDDYGKCAIDTARNLMLELDKGEPITDCHSMICKADEDSQLTGFLAGCVADMVFQCHERGDEFRKVWNLEQSPSQGEEVNEKGGVINPAIMTIEV